VYLGRLSTAPSDRAAIASWQSYIVFIVTDDAPADVLFECSDSTRVPTTADSLYTRGANGQSLHDDFDVSFDRPYGRQAQFESVVCDPLSFGSGEFLSLEFPTGWSSRATACATSATPIWSSRRRARAAKPCSPWGTTSTLGQAAVRGRNRAAGRRDVAALPLGQLRLLGRAAPGRARRAADAEPGRPVRRPGARRRE
jgi:hypothetical protein